MKKFKKDFHYIQYVELLYFKKMVDDLTKEHQKSEWPITCEFSTRKTFMLDKLLYIGKKEVSSSHKWYLGECSTCKQYHIEFPFHVEIDKKDRNW